MESLDEILTRHRREQKDLQAKVTQKKKSATKKTRKGINLECEELERQLRERQECEREVVDESTVQKEEISSVHELLESNPVENTPINTSSPPEPSPATLSLEIVDPSVKAPKKRNRQRERLARREAEKHAAIAEAEQEALNQPDKRTIERTKILDQINAKGLVEKVIRPDGHCLFSAIADQLLHLGILDAEKNTTEKDKSYIVIRKAAAKYIEEHPNDFAAWLDEPLAQYAQKIRDTAEWGGHLELLALANTYNLVINILQEGAPQKIEPSTDGKAPSENVWLVYYRNGFGLGEHYNSLHTTTADDK